MDTDNTRDGAEPSPASAGSRISLYVSVAVLIINVCLLLSILALRALEQM